MAREKLCVGIDLGASSVKLCQLKRTKTGYALLNFGLVPLPSEAVVDGALMNSPRIVEAIQELMAAHRIKNKHVALSISGHSVIIKKIPLPQMSAAELQESIQWEAEQFIPFDIQDVHIDVQIVNQQSAQQGQMDVVLVAAKKDLVNEYTSVIIEAGLEPVICDVDAFAVQNMFEANYENALDSTVALVNVGASKTNINIISGGIPSFTRDLTIGGNAFTEEIQKQMNLSFDEAESLKIGGTASGRDTDVVIPHDVQRALQSVAENVTSEVQRSIDFYAATSADPTPSELYLTGGSARLQALARALEARINVPVHTVDPFRRIALNPQDEGYLRSFGPAAGVAVGLALRYAGDG
ncbi:MAG: pilus assembly protein PilM [Deltaproteobacteria bacterium RIFOXYA12_FULL_58_15]|nr:MAG: pilus assembly protein PilM [Deltaproteobacteria bacterium RIFOXYA12_FULL_58_15]OGR08954.1 MAG: pilus assembly protein PilM [Deltaproteobacteria bacterium RIFOXYB12_FULL_58_9]